MTLTVGFTSFNLASDKKKKRRTISIRRRDTAKQKTQPAENERLPAQNNERQAALLSRGQWKPEKTESVDQPAHLILNATFNHAASPWLRRLKTARQHFVSFAQIKHPQNPVSFSIQSSPVQSKSGERKKRKEKIPRVKKRIQRHSPLSQVPRRQPGYRSRKRKFQIRLFFPDSKIQTHCFSPGLFLSVNHNKREVY